MRLRSFTAKSLPEAMRKVREAMGPNAVILSQQSAESGAGVCLTAALEDDPAETFDFSAASAVHAIDDIAEALAYHRFPTGLLDRLLAAAAGLPATDPLMALAGALDNEFAFAPLPAAQPPRPIMLVGPHGGGKSATAAKLCARARLQRSSVRLVTMDTAKSGALAQATAFAQALGVELAPAADVEALCAAVDGDRNGHLIVIDTAGANPFDESDLRQLAASAKAIGAGLVLVLPAGVDAAEAAESAMAFAEIGADRMISTRLDTARRLGGLLTASQAGRLALMAVSDSPHIGDALRPVNPVALARLLMPNLAAAESDTLVRRIG